MTASKIHRKNRTADFAVAFIGYGIHAPELGCDDFAGIDLENKIVLFFLGVPGLENSRPPFSRPETQSLHNDLRKKLEEVKKRGAAALLSKTS